jgi:hypothetical protein
MAAGRWRTWLFPTGGLLSAMLAAACVTYLGWRYVPYHLGRLAEAHALIPVSAAWAIVISKWVVRLLPFLVTLLFILGPVFAVVFAVALARVRPQIVARVSGIAFLCLALGQALLCVVMLYGIHAAYATVPE